MQLCKQCDTSKPSDQFYSSNRTKCKECCKANVKENYRKNVDRYKAYERRRAKLPHRVKARDEYTRTDHGKERSSAAKLGYIERNADKRAAHGAVSNALRSGKIKKADQCEHCGASDKLHGHHHDYSLPLSVVWLCPSCHRQIHAFMDLVEKVKQRDSMAEIAKCN